MLTLFSAGGEDNGDLPLGSSYRTVTPKALTITIKDEDVKVEPWDIDWKSYNDPERNAFFKAPPEIQHRQ